MLHFDRCRTPDYPPLGKEHVDEIKRLTKNAGKFLSKAVETRSIDWSFYAMIETANALLLGRDQKALEDALSWGGSDCRQPEITSLFKKKFVDEGILDEKYWSAMDDVLEEEYETRIHDGHWPTDFYNEKRRENYVKLAKEFLGLAKDYLEASAIMEE